MATLLCVRGSGTEQTGPLADLFPSPSPQRPSHPQSRPPTRSPGEPPRRGAALGVPFTPGMRELAGVHTEHLGGRGQSVRPSVRPGASPAEAAGSRTAASSSPAAKSRAIAIPVDLDSQVNNLFLKSHNIVQKTALNWRLSARNAARRDSVLAASRDYRNIIERLQVTGGCPAPRCAREGRRRAEGEAGSGRSQRHRSVGPPGRRSSPQPAVSKGNAEVCRFLPEAWHRAPGRKGREASSGRGERSEGRCGALERRGRGLTGPRRLPSSGLSPRG